MLNTKGKDTLEKNLISNIVFELLSYMAQKERDKIRSRQAEGIASLRARNNGKGIGRPVTIDVTDRFAEVYKQWKAEDFTAVKAMAMLGLSKATFYRKVKEYEAQEQG